MKFNWDVKTKRNPKAALFYMTDNTCGQENKVLCMKTNDPYQCLWIYDNQQFPENITIQPGPFPDTSDAIAVFYEGDSITLTF